MNCQAYPFIKKNIYLRVSKGRFLIKNVRTEDGMMDTKENMIFLSMCNGENTLGDIIEAYSQAFQVERKVCEEKAEELLERYQDYMDLLEEPCQDRHISSFLKQIQYREKEWKYHPLREESPFALAITIDENCNHRCNYCFKSCTVKGEDEISLEDWRRVVDEAAEIGVQEITISGGEPTLVPWFLELVEYIVQKGMYPKISTNGSKMTDSFVKKLKQTGAEYIHLSLPAVTEERFLSITQVSETLKTIKEGIKLLHENGFYIRVKTVLVPDNAQNLDEMEELINFCAESGVNLLHLAPFIYTPHSRGGEALIVHDQDLLQVKELAERKQKQFQDKIIIAAPEPGVLQWKSECDIVKCGGIKESFAILSNGVVSLCESAGALEEFSLGNIKEYKIMELWESDKPDKISQVNMDRVSETCKDCENLQSCKTGCFLFSYNMDRNPWSEDPRCWKCKRKDNIFRKYPILKNTARLKKLPWGCWLTEVEKDVDMFIAPMEACILALCNGEIARNTLSYIIEQAFHMKQEQAEKIVEEALEKFEDCLEWQAAPRLMVTRYDAKDFIFLPEDGELKTEARCETPCEMDLSITRACNFRCIYCFNASMNKRDDELTTEEWLDVIRQGHELGVVKCMVTGGEPLMHPGFLKIIEEIRKYDMLPYICTNGSLMTDEIINKLKELGVETIQLSLDTTDPEVHDKLTDTVGQLEKVKNTIQKLTNASIKVFIKSVITPINIQQVPNLIDTCLELGVKKLVLDRFDVSSCGRGSLDLVLSKEQILSLREMAYEKKDLFEGRMEVKAVAHSTRWNGEEDVVPCGAFRKSFIVLANGDISACEKLIGVQEMTAGNVRERSLRDIWVDEHTSEIVNPKQEQLDESCKKCEFFEKCGTGCYAIKHYFHRKIYGIDPRCFENKEIDNPYLLGRGC